MARFLWLMVYIQKDIICLHTSLVHQQNKKYVMRSLQLTANKNNAGMSRFETNIMFYQKTKCDRTTTHKTFNAI